MIWKKDDYTSKNLQKSWYNYEFFQIQAEQCIAILKKIPTHCASTAESLL